MESREGRMAIVMGKAVRVQNVYLKNPRCYDFSRYWHVGEKSINVNKKVVALNTGGLFGYSSVYSQSS